MEDIGVCCDTKTGVVVAVKGEIATVEIAKDFACNGCKACAFAGEKKIKLSAINKLGAVPGDEVLVQAPPPRPVAAFLVLLFIPLILFVLSLCVASTAIKNELVVFAISISVTALGLVLIFLLDRIFISKRFYAKVIAYRNDL